MQTLRTSKQLILKIPPPINFFAILSNVNLHLALSHLVSQVVPLSPRVGYLFLCGLASSVEVGGVGKGALLPALCIMDEYAAVRKA